MDRTVVNLRGTIFINKIIIFSPDIVVYMKTIFEKDFIVLFNNNPFMLPNAQITEWTLQSVDKSLSIIFSFNKIDIINNVKSDMSEKSFLDFVQDKFKNIKTKYSLEISRMAFAPSYLVQIDSFGEFVKSIFNKNSFGDFHDCSFNNTFVKKEQINEETVNINYCGNFSAFKGMNLNDATIKKIFVQMDINTTHNVKYSYSDASIMDFFTKVGDFSEKFYNFYFKK